MGESVGWETGHAARVWLAMASARVRSHWQYRASFVIQFVSQGAVTFLDFVEILFLFHFVPALAGWSVTEVALLYGLSCTSFGLVDAFVGQVEHVDRLVKQGRLDAYLVRPAGLLVQICADDFAMRRLGKAVQGIGVLVVAVAAVDVVWTAPRLAMLAIGVAGGSVIFGSMFVLLASAVFWLIDGREFMNAFTYGGNYATQYPLDILQKWLRHLMTVVLPTAFVAYLPAAWILGRPNAFGAPPAIAFLAPVVALAIAGVARLAWGGAIRHYRSTGS